tara:strand:+ start:845 stop:2725 length:1881 start_codon:yes stop_codon:yes gene_type:complete
MKDTLININLETSTSPVIAETRGRDWIEYGDANGDWRNLYPQFLIDLYYSSSISAAIINATSEMIAGEALIIEDKEERDLEARVKLQHFLDRANSNESLHEVIKKLSFDFKLQGAFALNIVYARDRSQGISEIYHIASEKIRCAKPDEFGKVNGYYISSDWSNTRTNKPYYVPAFNPNDRTSANQIMYSGLYSPNMNCYYTPDYVSCNNWALIDSKVSEYHLNNITNSFSGSYLFSFNNGTPTSEERRKIEQSIKDKFTSEKAAGRFVLCFSDDRNRAPEITPLNTADLSEQYLALQELLTSNICSGHRVTSKTLVGIDSKNGFSSNTDELINASDFYNQTVIRPFQDQLIKQLRKIFQVNQMDMPVQFVQLKPITVQFDSKTIREVMTTDEIREELGLEPLDNEEETVEETVDFSNVEKTELDKFIEEFGEDIPEDWEIVDEEIVDGEHEDFDFEEVLNEIANEKLELASTGRANPNARDKQDGLNKKGTAFFKVRYVYTKNKSLSQQGETREFCKLMMRARKIYRKKDIINMGSKAVNKGWGPRGAATYSIWLWKGGGNCHHYWKRAIYQAPAVDDNYVVYPDNITSDKLITSAKARSEGFTIEKNDSLVARAPKTMTNNGFLN